MIHRVLDYFRSIADLIFLWFIALTVGLATLQQLGSPQWLIQVLNLVLSLATGRAIARRRTRLTAKREVVD